MKALIVDDEPPARREMRRLLEAFPEVRIVGEAGDLAVASGMLQRTRPDVVFLDIKLGRRSGFELLREIDGETAVVFVTAYDAFAARAFDASAVDYLVKPVSPDRLRVTVGRLMGRADAVRGARDAAPGVFSGRRWIFLDSREGPEFLQVAGITHIEAEEGGTRVHLRDGRARWTPRALGDWEARLDAADFVRVHRSTIVNLGFVERVEEWSHYSYRLSIAGFDGHVVMSRRYAARLRELMT